MPATRKRRAAANSGGISGQLREIVARRGLKAYSIAQEAGVSASVVSRFLSRERGLTLETLDAIAEALGLRLVEKGKGRARVEAPGPGARPEPVREIVPEPTIARPEASGPTID